MPYVTFSDHMLFSAVGVLFLCNSRRLCVLYPNLFCWVRPYFRLSSALALSQPLGGGHNTRCTRSIERKRSQHSATHPLGRFVNMAHCGLSVCRALQSEVIVHTPWNTR